ncbi:methionine synthase [Oligella ureolytica]
MSRRRCRRDPYFVERKIPLMIGGATTSRVHTAVKIAPKYEGPVIYVPDASRSVGVCTSLVSDNVDTFVEKLAEEYELVRQRHANRKANPLISIEDARANKVAIDWANYTPPKPKFIGRREIANYDLAEIVKFFDWGPFFNSWGLFGKFPQILEDEVVGKEAQELYENAKIMLKKIVDGRWLTASGVVGFYPANTVNDDDIELYTDESRSEVLLTWRNIRSQGKSVPGIYNKCLADYIAPKDSGVADYIGMFAVTGGLGIEKHVERFEAEGDDYSSIMIKALADRFAEGFAEALHHRVRTDLWGYVPEENLESQELIDEKYQGVRPAPGYPACPEHTVKADMFEVLEPEKIGMHITESYAMIPASSVSGFYFSHPESSYFSVGSIGEDQLHDYTERSEISLGQAKRQLSSVLE